VVGLRRFSLRAQCISTLGASCKIGEE
jgi:hypothetical protein